VNKVFAHLKTGKEGMQIVNRENRMRESRIMTTIIISILARKGMLSLKRVSDRDS